MRKSAVEWSRSEGSVRLGRRPIAFLLPRRFGSMSSLGYLYFSSPHCCYCFALCGHRLGHLERCDSFCLVDNSEFAFYHIGMGSRCFIPGLEVVLPKLRPSRPPSTVICWPSGAHQNLQQVRTPCARETNRTARHTPAARAHSAMPKRISRLPLADSSADRTEDCT